MNSVTVDGTQNQILRRQLFEAAGIVIVTRHALASTLEGLDETSVIDALSAAERIIDGVAAALNVSETDR